MKTEAETEVRHLQVKEYQGLPVSTRSWARGLEQTSLSISRRNQSCPQAWLCTSSLRNHEKRRFDCFKSGLKQHYLHDSVTWGDLNQKVMPSDPSNLRWLLGLLSPVATLLTPYNQMHEESEFPVTLALSPEKEACLKEGPGIFCVKLENGPVPGARRPGSAGGPTLFRGLGQVATSPWDFVSLTEPRMSTKQAPRSLWPCCWIITEAV